jgi:hypothetical protein
MVGSCEPTRTTEEMTDDGATWGKTTARPRGLAMRKESMNGVAERWLAGGE